MSYRDNYDAIDWSHPIALPQKRITPLARSDLGFPMVLSDSMEPTEHPCDGNSYDSRSKFRAVTKTHGCIEMGNDPARLRPKAKSQPDRKAIRESVQRAFARI